MRTRFYLKMDQLCHGRTIFITLEHILLDHVSLQVKYLLPAQPHSDHCKAEWEKGVQ